MNNIIYLDSAASYLKSQSVIDAQVRFLTQNYANAGRGICARATATDNMITDVRRQVADFINAQANQIVFTNGTTDAMNRIANMLRGRVVAVSDLDHHSARLPFVNAATDVKLIPLGADLNFDLKNVPVADVYVITAMSNVLGIAQNVPEMIQAIRKINPGAVTVVDAAQFVVHEKIDVADWGCDFLCFSGHKIGADTGVGVMYIKEPEKYFPDKFGGGMVKKVSENEIVLSDIPERFEAGTLPLTQIAGLGVAIKKLEAARPNLQLIKYLHDGLSQCSRIKILTSPTAAVLSFVVDGMHVLDFGALIGARGVCVRVGNMCASWIHRVMGIDGSIRISVGAYNTMDEIETVLKYIKDILK